MTQMNTDIAGGPDDKRDPITHDIIGSAFEVYRVLGYGFLEKVYQRAMQVELRLRGRSAAMEHRIPVRYKGEGVGDYVADFSGGEPGSGGAEGGPEYQPADEAQLLDELKATASRWYAHDFWPDRDAVQADGL